MLHSNATKNHVIHAFSYANATARLAATGFTSADINKLCLQTDTNEFYMLTATTPTWVKVAGVTFESALGNPTSDGYVLSSTASGVRSWVPPGGGGGGGAGNSYFPDLVVPNLADWTAINGGAATTIDGTSKGIFVRVDTVSGQSIARIGHYRTAPSTPYTKTLGVVPMLFNTNTCTGIGFRKSSNGYEKYLFFMPAQSGLLRMIRYDNTDNFSGITGVSNDLSGGSLSLVRDNIPDGPIWLQVSNDGTNLYWSMSVDAGEHFETMYSEANSSYFGGNPDQIVIAVTSGQSVGVISRTKYVHYN